MTIQEEGNSNTGMWGHYCETSSVYKRTPSRDYSSMTDVEENSDHLGNNFDNETSNPSWKLSLSHVLVATISSFLFGYHLGVVNEPLGSIYLDLGFSENTLAEGLVVSICLGGALIGCLLSGWIADGVGRCRAFQLCALPMIIGSSTSQVGVTDTVGAAENILEAEETNSVMAHSHVAANPRATLLRRSSRIMRLNLMMNDYVRGK